MAEEAAPKEIIKPIDREKEFGKLRTIRKEEKVLSTGYPSLDDFFQLAKKYLMVVTGYPGSGKSEFVDCVLLNMSILHNWKTLYYSPENDPTEEHMAKLAEKYIGKNINKFTPKEMTEALEYINKHFTWLSPQKNFTLDHLKKLAREEIAANGLDCLVFDPWNSVGHTKGGMARDEYLEQELTKLLRFAKKHDILVIIIAHPKTPQKLKTGAYPDADLYSISDGAMWRNKTDYGLVISRPDQTKHSLIVTFGKIKFKWMGHVGFVELDYEYSSGRLKDQGAQTFELPTTDIAPPF